MELIVSLPRNEVELARAAEEGGADAIKLHLNALHHASGTRFGSFAEELPRLEAILDAVELTVGIMPGTDRLPSPEELAELNRMGISFLDIYYHHMPLWLMKMPNFNKIPALDWQAGLEDIFELSRMNAEGLAEFAMVELSIVHPDDYGQPLSLADLLRYRSFIEASQLPVLIPTQKAIQPEEVEVLAELGVEAVMIGVVVTGQEAGQVEQATRAFRQAIDRL